MWVFLATEVMFFGGLLTAFAVYRTTSPEAVALASRHLNVWLGCLNTVVLLTSSLTMALAVRAAQLRQHRPLLICLILTMVFGTTFLGIKAVEYTQEYHEKLIPGWNFEVPRAGSPAKSRAKQIDLGRMKMFFVLYFFMTGLHAIHLIIGIGLGRGDGLALVEAVVFRRRCGADRGDRVVLALCRRGLGVSLSAALLDRRTPMKQHVASIRTNIVIFVLLLLLLLATVGAAYLPMGPLHFPVAMTIAAIKAVLDRAVLHARAAQSSADAGDRHRVAVCGCRS